jgi:hypothetical protein
MKRVLDKGGEQSGARPATDTPKDVELARRLAILTDPAFDADCVNSTAPIVARLSVWGAIATAAWLVMMWRVH